MLQFFGANNKKISEAGKFEVFIGNSSEDKNLLKEEFKLIK
jgi:hypothetical protein